MSVAQDKDRESDEAKKKKEFIRSNISAVLISVMMGIWVSWYVDT